MKTGVEIQQSIYKRYNGITGFEYSRDLDMAFVDEAANVLKETIHILKTNKTPREKAVFVLSDTIRLIRNEYNVKLQVQGGFLEFFRNGRILKKLEKADFPV